MVPNQKAKTESRRQDELCNSRANKKKAVEESRRQVRSYTPVYNLYTLQLRDSQKHRIRTAVQRGALTLQLPHIFANECN